MNFSFTRNAARSDKDGYAAHTGQQENLVTVHLCTFCAAARGKAPKEPPNCSGTAGMLA
jgi:sulfur relay (sulfurtransferase) complex TusBCD TusD component (DsrE family)